MPRPERFLFPAALLAAALIGLGLLRRGSGVQAAETPAPAASTAQLDGELAAFLGDLSAFRAGDDARLPALCARAEELCRRWQRCDVVDVAAYYAGLDRAARLCGIEDERRGLALRERASAAGRDGLDQEAWQHERQEILAGLEELADSIPPAGDRVPAAQATALAARLRVEHLRRAESLSDSERESELAALDLDLARSSEIFVRAGMRRPRIELDWIHGVRARTEQRPREAETRLEHCLAEARSLGERGWQERALEELHELSQEAGDLPRMEELIGELAALDAPGLSWTVVRRYAELLIWNEQPARAADFLRDHPAPEGPARDEHALLCGHCLLRTGDVDGALAAYASIGPDSKQSRNARIDEARALLARGANADALARVESVGPGRAQDLGQRGFWLTVHAEALIALGRRAQAIRELTDALDAAATAQTRLFEEREASQTTNAFGEVLGLHAVELLARAQLGEGDALGAACTIENAQTRTLRLSDGAPRSQLSRGDLVAWARHFELGLLTWVVGADETLVVLVEPDGSARGERIAHGRKALQEAVRRLRETVLATDDRRRERLAGELCSVLLPGALRDELLARAGTRPARLCFLLHGPLEELPIEAFEDGAWLSETIAPVVLPGLPANAPAEAWDPSVATRWRLLGDPCRGAGEHLLPGAQEELEGIARLRPDAQLAIGLSFDREHLTGALESGDCLHIATHVRHGGGSAAARTDEARFALSNEVEFRLDEVAALTPRAPLVVLTGCETGGGRFADSLGLQGLGRAFLEGGTRNLVATSWPVEDRWARAFALALHRALALGFPPSRATAEARRSLRAQGAPCSECAAFRLIGQD